MNDNERTVVTGQPTTVEEILVRKHVRRVPGDDWSTMSAAERRELVDGGDPLDQREADVINALDAHHYWAGKRDRLEAAEGHGPGVRHANEEMHALRLLMERCARKVISR